MYHYYWFKKSTKTKNKINRMMGSQFYTHLRHLTHSLPVSSIPPGTSALVVDISASLPLQQAHPTPVFLGRGSHRRQDGDADQGWDHGEENGWHRNLCHAEGALWRQVGAISPCDPLCGSRGGQGGGGTCSSGRHQCHHVIKSRHTWRRVPLSSLLRFCKGAD